MRWIPVALMALVAAPSLADPVYDMCMKPGNHGPEQCDCASVELRRALSPEEHALYSSLAGRYLGKLGEGLSQSDAWDAAVQAEARARGANYAGLLGTANAIARRDREIKMSCGGG